MGWLSAAIWVPIISGIVVLAVGNEQRATLSRWLALLGSLVGFAVTIPLYTGFDRTTAALQFVERKPWIESLGIEYSLGIDGLSVWLVLLTAFITIVVVIAGWEVIKDRVHQYLGAFLILSGLMIGVFAAADGMLFYVFFEATLIPMYIIIGVWGGPNRVYAAFKFFLYTLLGSLLTMVAIIYLYLQSGSFEILAWHRLPLTLHEQVLIFVAFLLAFAVKIPMWPVHTWLPDAHVEAPTGGSVVLAAIMLKLGAYAFLRLSLPIAPDASHELAWLMITLSLVAVIYIGLVALVQTDMKKLVAYSSIAHMGFVTLGFFMFNETGMQGAVVQMVSHGFVAGAMFLCIGVLYDRLHTRQIADYGPAVLDGQRGPAGHLRLRGRVPGHPGRGAVRLLDWPAGRHGSDLGRGLFAVDVQARGLRPGGQSQRRQDGRREPARVLAADADGRTRPVHGHLSEVLHRPDPGLGGAAAHARFPNQAQVDIERHGRVTDPA